MSLKYILVTPAKNEEANLERTIESVLAQTLRPKKWIIVSDGSTDNTDNIGERYSQKYIFIEFIRNDRSGKHDFGSKADIVNRVFKSIQKEDFDLFGNLDADIQLPEDYYEKIIFIDWNPSYRFLSS